MQFNLQFNCNLNHNFPKLFRRNPSNHDHASFSSKFHTQKTTAYQSRPGNQPLWSKSATTILRTLTIAVEEGKNQFPHARYHRALFLFTLLHACGITHHGRGIKFSLIRRTNRRFSEARESESQLTVVRCPTLFRGQDTRALPFSFCFLSYVRKEEEKKKKWLSVLSSVFVLPRGGDAFVWGGDSSSKCLRSQHDAHRCVCFATVCS